MLQEFVERLQVFQAPVLSRPHLAQLSAQFHEPDVLPRLFVVLPSQDFVSLGEDELRQLRLHMRTFRNQARQPHQGLLPNAA